jgi:hypothetical protein
MPVYPGFLGELLDSGFLIGGYERQNEPCKVCFALIGNLEQLP